MDIILDLPHYLYGDSNSILFTHLVKVLDKENAAMLRLRPQKSHNCSNLKYLALWEHEISRSF